MSHALVSGANRGLGLGFVQQLLARGGRVVATCRHPGRALELTKLAGEYPGHLRILPLDVDAPRSIDELARELAVLDVRVDLLVNNAGVLVDGERFGTLDGATLASTFTTNVIGPVLLTQALAERLVDGGKVVAVGSGLGSIARTTRFGTPSYAISKAALHMAMRQLGHALAPRGIAVAALSPGWVRTAMGGDHADLGVDESVAAMLGVIDALRFDEASIGTLFAHTGRPMPW
ncbi:SDR family oxidoreductase [Dokdonella sp. MW10]|uniref:SDR family oxidoreductase n=1 Tax=Dokdonella sp. MW10 TaxID=2992926 RepID=UPI003F7D151D